jgi:gluconolactonase
MTWMKYELDENGLIKNKNVFYKVNDEEKKVPGGPDGMKMSKNGYLFATGPGGVWIFNPNGKVLAKILTGHLTANCAFSKDEKTLFMTCNQFVCKLNLK